MARRRHIAFLDILGFRKIVETTPPEKILAVYKDIERLVQASIETRRERTQAMNKKADGNTYVAPVVELECKFFSDTILIYSQTDVDRTLYEADQLCALLIELYNYLLLRHSWLIRGAFAIGELYAEGPAVFGKDLIRAYLAEQDQEWAAIIALDKTDMMLNPHNIYTCECTVPFKSGAAAGTVLNFFVDHELPISFFEVLKKVADMRGVHTDSAIQKKLDNTLDLFELLIKRGVSAKARFEKQSLQDLDRSVEFFPHMEEKVEFLKRVKAWPLILP